MKFPLQCASPSRKGAPPFFNIITVFVPSHVTIMHFQKQKLDASGMKAAESLHSVPISPTSRFRQPLSSPSALYSDIPPPPGSATPLSPSSSLGGFPSSAGMFGRTISAGTYYTYSMGLLIQYKCNREFPLQYIWSLKTGHCGH